MMNPAIEPEHIKAAFNAINAITDLKVSEIMKGGSDSNPIVKLKEILDRIKVDLETISNSLATTSDRLAATSDAQRRVYQNCNGINKTCSEIEDSLVTNCICLPYADLFHSLIKSFIDFIIRYADWANTTVADRYRPSLAKTPSRTTRPSITLSETPPEYFIFEHAMIAFLNQVGFDLNVIVWAITQRWNTTIAPQLIHFDCFANNLITQILKAQPNLFDRDITNPNCTYQGESRPIIITYFSKLPTTRMIPYSPIVLLGIPNETLSCNQYAAIAHEIGHLIFWKGYCDKLPTLTRDAKSREIDLGNLLRSPRGYTPLSGFGGAKFVACLNRYLRAKLGGSPWIADGLEQIMADVVVAMNLGAKTTMDFAFSRAYSQLLERTFNDNLRYQLPIELRVEIYLRVLELSGKKALNYRSQWINYYNDTSKAGKSVRNEGLLGKLFGVEVENGGTEDYVRPLTVKPYGSTGEGLDYEEAKEALLETVDLIFWLLGGKSTPTNIPSPDAAQLQTYAKSKKDIWGPGYPGDTNWTQWKDRLKREEKDTNEVFKKLGGGPDRPKLTDSERDWLAIFYAGGWMMQSPGNSSGPY